ncbi:MAG: thrombospondin type 3 repeat-containing protein [Gammaproteobacteria bacterium]
MSYKLLTHLLGAALICAVTPSTLAQNVGDPDEIVEFFDSGAGPIPGPYGGGPGLNAPAPVDPEILFDSDIEGWVSLPENSYITVRFNQYPIINGPGDDIEIIEIGSANERADISVSTDGINFTSIGIANGNTESYFDIAGLGTIDYIRITGLDSNGSSPGFDLSSVNSLNSTQNIALYAETILEYVDSGAGPIPGPYGGTGLGSPVTVPIEVAIGPEPGPVGPNDYLSLPEGSFIVLGFVTGQIVDGLGPDFVVSEVGSANEEAEISVSSNGIDFVSLGIASASTTTNFDLNGTGIVEPVRAIKVMGLDSFGNSPGFDLVGIGVYGQSVEFIDTDTDLDSISDELDNCITASNFGQVDTDMDGFGNACDADFNQSCSTNFFDISLFSAEFLGSNQLFDLNDDGAVNFLDYAVINASFLQPPGPSGTQTECIPDTAR